MKYCADTWFILSVFGNEPKAISIINETKFGKARIVIPVIAYAEAIKKLMQRGVSSQIIHGFFGTLEALQKIEIVDANKSIAEEAARVSLSYSVPLIDSFIAATYKLTGCEIFLSSDSDYSALIKRKYLKNQSW